MCHGHIILVTDKTAIALLQGSGTERSFLKWQPQLSHNLNTLKGGYRRGYIEDLLSGSSRGDTRSFDYG